MVRVSFNYKNLTNSKQEQFISNVKLTDIEIKKYELVFYYNIIENEGTITKTFKLQEYNIPLAKSIVKQLKEYINNNVNVPLEVFELRKNNQYFGLTLEYDLEVFYLIYAEYKNGVSLSVNNPEEGFNCDVIQIYQYINSGECYAYWRSIYSEPSVITSDDYFSRIEVDTKASVYEQFNNGHGFPDIVRHTLHFDNVDKRFMNKIVKEFTKRYKHNSNCLSKRIPNNHLPFLVEYFVIGEDNLSISNTYVLIEKNKYINFEYEHLFRLCRRLSMLNQDQLKNYGIQEPTYSWLYKLKHAIKNILNID